MKSKKRKLKESSKKIFIERKRIYALLENIMQYRVVLVQAYKGFGKTTALKHYLAQIEKEVIWIDLDNQDNISFNFWEKFVHEVVKKNPQYCHFFSEIDFPSSDIKFDEFISQVNKPSYYLDDFYLIFDNFHVITDPLILRFVENLIFKNYTNYHMFIISDWEPQLDFVKLYQSGMIADIDHKQLRFTYNEIKYLLKQQQIESENACSEVYRVTEGWPIAVNLAVSFLNEQVFAEELEIRLKPVIFQIIDEDIFPFYDTVSQQALVEISAIDSLTIPLVQNMTGLLYEQMKKIIEKNSFIHREESSQNLILQYLFREYLINKRKSPEFDIVYSSSGELEDNNIKETKINIEYTKRMKSIRSNLNRRGKRTADYYIRLIKDQNKVESNPEKLLYEVMLLINNNELRSAEEMLLKLEKKINRPETNLDESWEGEVCLLLGLCHFYLGIQDYREYFNKAALRLTNGSKIIDYTYTLIDIDYACIYDRQSLGNDIYIDDNLLADFRKVTGGCGAGAESLIVAERAYLSGDLTKAEKRAYAASFQASETKQNDILLNACFILMRIYTYRGEYTKAVDVLSRIRMIGNSIESGKKNYLLGDIILSWFYAKIDNFEKVERWILDINSIQNLISPLSYGRDKVFQVFWLLIVNQDYDAAKNKLIYLEGIFKKKNDYPCLIYVYAMNCLLYVHKENLHEASENLRKLYFMDEEYGISTILIEGGKYTTYFLKKIKKYEHDAVPEEWIEKIEHQASIYERKLNYFKRIYNSEHQLIPDFKLTDMEYTILDDLSHGLSRIKIADRLHITDQRIKNYMRDIYKKLGADNLADAVHIYTLYNEKRISDPK